MNLEECLRAIETGMAGQEHADWLRQRENQRATEALRFHDLRHSAYDWAKLWKRAAKKYYEKWTIQDTLADLGHLAQITWMRRAKENRADAVRVALECKVLQTKLTTVTEELEQLTETTL